MSLRVKMVITCDEPGCPSAYEGDVELEALRLWLETRGCSPLLRSPPPGWMSRGTRHCVCPDHEGALPEPKR